MSMSKTDAQNMKLLKFEEVITSFLAFKDAALGASYHEFCEDRISLKVTKLVLLLYAVIYGVEILYYSNLSAFPSVALVLAMVLYLCLFPVGLRFLGTHQSDHKSRNLLENLLMFGMCVESTLLFVCGDFGLMPQHRDHLTLTPEIVIVFMTPLLMSILFHNTEGMSVIFCMICGTFFIVNANWHVFDLTSTFAVLSYVFLSAVVTYEYRRQIMSKFLLHQNLKIAMKENERISEDMLASEMRHMIANVAHDLKTPLAGFVNVNELVANIVADCEVRHQTKTLTPECMFEYIVSLRSCVETTKSINTFMLMTINRCIDYTKASQGLKLVPYFGTVCLSEALSLPLCVMRDIQSKIVIVLHSISSRICSHIITDLQWMQENILCLLSNAIKYSSAGEVTVSITLKSFDQLPKPLSGVRVMSPSQSIDSQDPPQYILFEIEDNGIGLSDEAMANLFNPFKQAQRLTGGTGLGLYSLAKRMDALSGFYGVQKRKDGAQGARFWFAIPYRPDYQSAEEATANIAVTGPQLLPNTVRDVVDANATAARSSPVPGLLNQPTMHPLHVLVVDDSLPILKLTGMLLKRNGHTTQQVENGSDAVDILNSHTVTFDVVLMDLQMPVMDGLEATRRIRAREASVVNKYVKDSLQSKRLRVNALRPTRQIIIGMSANGDTETISEAYAAGVDSFMAKPFTLKTFYETYARVSSYDTLRSDAASRSVSGSSGTNTPTSRGSGSPVTVSGNGLSGELLSPTGGGGGMSSGLGAMMMRSPDASSGSANGGSAFASSKESGNNDTFGGGSNSSFSIANFGVVNFMDKMTSPTSGPVIRKEKAEKEN